MMSRDATTSVDLPLERVKRGKVREMFSLGDDLLMVATDRLSAFDIVFEQGIPDKGRVLTGLSAFWFDRCHSAVPHHALSVDIDEILRQAPELADRRVALEGRTTLCRRARPIAVECVVRGYLDGSGWREYRETGAVTGIELPPDLQRGARLPEPIFTPATKAETGHDENITYGRLVEEVGDELADRLRERSLELYREGSEHAAACGLILADTKFEFGWSESEGGDPLLLLIDEVMTPDSSRFWDAEAWEPGGPQTSFDKQPVRDFLQAKRDAGEWDGEPPLPALSDGAISATTERYREAYRRIVGRPLPGIP